MAILVKSNAEKSIIILGTELKLDSVYARFEFAARADGKTLEIAVTTYASRLTYESNQPIFTDVQQGNFTVEILPTEMQEISVVNKYASLAYEQMGYTTEIIPV
jgi:reverse gyrase